MKLYSECFMCKESIMFEERDGVYFGGQYEHYPVVPFIRAGFADKDGNEYFNDKMEEPIIVCVSCMNRVWDYMSHFSSQPKEGS